MKNIKSKIVVPALGIILLSTAASISGSVAWFTANRNATVNVGDFSVARLAGNLSCTLDTFGVDHAAAYGVTVNTGTNTISIPSTNIMLNSSYDHVNDKLFYTEDASTFTEKSGETNWIHSTYSGNTYYFAVKWKMTFSFQFGADTTQQDLFFDPTSALTRITNGEGTYQTYKGFRICLYNGSEKMVWAPEQNESDCHFIKNTNPVARAEYSASGNGDLVASNTAAANLIAESATPASGDTSKKNYICSFTGSANTSTEQVVTAVAWYEGTDPNVINEADLDKVSAQLKFFVHQHVA